MSIMSANSQPFDDVLKKEVQSKLLNVILTAVEKHEFYFNDMKNSSRFILSGLDGVKNYDDLLIFLDALKHKWEVFAPVYDIYKHTDRDVAAREKQVIDKLSRYIHDMPAKASN